MLSPIDKPIDRADHPSHDTAFPADTNRKLGVGVSVQARVSVDKRKAWKTRRHVVVVIYVHPGGGGAYPSPTRDDY